MQAIKCVIKTTNIRRATNPERSYWRFLEYLESMNPRIKYIGSEILAKCTSLIALNGYKSLFSPENRQGTVPSTSKIKYPER